MIGLKPGTSSIADFVLHVAKATKSYVSDRTGAVLARVAGVGPQDEDDFEEDDGEIGDDVPMFGAPGMVCRPLPPNDDGHAEAVCMRTADGLIPIGWRDTRLDRAFPSGPKEGTNGIAGYAGGVVSFDMTSSNSGSKKANILVAYVPFDFDGSGVARKAMAFICDPEQESMSMSINTDGSSGYMMSLSAEGFMVNTPSAGTWMKLSDQQFFLQCPIIQLQGNVSQGSNVAAAVPLLPGVASPPSTSVFIAP